MRSTPRMAATSVVRSVKQSISWRCRGTWTASAEGIYRGYMGLYWGYIGIMEQKMETTIVYRGYIGIMEKKMETTIMGYI